MNDLIKQSAYTLGDDEKVAQVMAYTANALYWGDVIVKKAIRISTWLRTNSAPDWVGIYQARMIMTTTQNKPMFFSSVQIATSKINIFHLVPPAKDPIDYDPTEPNRKMEPVTLLINNFVVDGCLRLATQTTVAKLLEISRENFSPVYDAHISNPLLPSFGTISVPYILIRQDATVFGQRANP